MKKFFLVGNPNTGKTTLFNTLTASKEHTGNWHGVTVEEKQKSFDLGFEKCLLTDLPGLYSLSPLSAEEKVSQNQIFSCPDATVVLCCDAKSLRKNLYLAVDMLLFGAQRIIFAVNTMGSSAPQKNTRLLGLPAVFFSFASKKEVALLKSQMQKVEVLPQENIFQNVFSARTLHALERLSNKFDVPIFDTLKLAEGDQFFENKHARILHAFQNVCPLETEDLILEKYAFIDRTLAPRQSPPKALGREKLDKVLLNKFLAIPIFLLIMLSVFYLTFFGPGATLAELLRTALSSLVTQPISTWLEGVGTVPWVVSLLRDGIFSGAVALLGFLPQVLMLFVCLAIMEESGYFARVAFVFEDVFAPLGLSGKSVYTLLMGFGCTASAVLTTRALDTKNIRIKTALSTGFITCSAKLPIFAALGGAFFGAGNVGLVMALYFLGIFCALFSAVIMDKFLPSKNSHFLLEFAALRMPSLKKVLFSALESAKVFLVKVATIFVAMSVIIWFLSRFDFSLNFCPENTDSILWGIGEFISPIFAPLGCGSVIAAVALLSGLVAKEVVVSTMAIFGGANFLALLSVPASPLYFSPAGMTAFLAFCLLYTPCIATLSVLKKELGLKWMAFSAVWQFALAYVVALMVHGIYKLGEFLGAVNLVLCTLSALVILISFVYAISRIKQKKVCTQCGRCKF